MTEVACKRCKKPLEKEAFEDSPYGMAHFDIVTRWTFQLTGECKECQNRDLRIFGILSPEDELKEPEIVMEDGKFKEAHIYPGQFFIISCTGCVTVWKQQNIIGSFLTTDPNLHPKGILDLVNKFRKKIFSSHEDHYRV